MCFVFPDKKPLDGIILLLIRVNNSGFTVMLGPAHLCFPFNFHTQRLHLCVLRYIQNDLSRYKIPAGEGIALIDRIVSNRNVWHLVSWCQYLLLTSELNSIIATTQSNRVWLQPYWASGAPLKSGNTSPPLATRPPCWSGQDNTSPPLATRPPCWSG